ncbi:hypothetical protein AMAG_14369 [Allomyces macrogynus ATCC 38327]|uniref:phenylalanine 4-monooxygenase n=1 Tax=Allomyces macrogynus (strain ATCC 38327) TaxID=578462 RepID=A0A0L0T4V2_ALLM3|nr:hypothetical protein AMAG_14369 [Allomyces macrogynus ATCC 38327]|eukprot:KNE69838.1 hypothetical protein AMAG_14369 [Allomyces macrogynus ATCC 38327]
MALSVLRNSTSLLGRAAVSVLATAARTPANAAAALAVGAARQVPATRATLTTASMPSHQVAATQVADAPLPGAQAAAAAAAHAAVARPPPPALTTLQFSIQDGVGALTSVLGVLCSDLGISLNRIESRPSKTRDWDYDFFVDFALPPGADQTAESIVAKLRAVSHVRHVMLVSTTDSGESHVAPTTAEAVTSTTSTTSTADTATGPWFPRKMSDLDVFAERVLSYGAELDADHPGFTDKAYRARRELITKNAKEYRTGMPLPRVNYTPDEVKTWGLVYDKLTAMYKHSACREHRYIFPLLEANCGYARDNVPQQADISRFLKECTGFTLRPVMGLLSSRDFLNALAFRVFYATQYVRHPSMPFYTPEPDICHELLGHVPLFADPDFADFSHTVGLASLGASDDEVKKLATLYWFTVEFGLCKEKNPDGTDGLKAYGAGLLSSTGELEYALSGKPELRPFDPAKAAVTPYPITEYQPVYYVAESFRTMKEQVVEYAASLKRPYAMRYNSATEAIEILDSKEKISRYAQGIQAQVHTLMDALDRLP